MVFNWVLQLGNGAVNMSSCLLHFSKHPECYAILNSESTLPWRAVLLWDLPCVALRRGMNYIVEELSSSFCTSDVVSWQFAITWSSLAMRVCPVLCPYPPKCAIWAKPRQLVSSLKHQVVVPSETAIAKLLLVVWIPADLSSNILCLACLRWRG